MNATLPNAAMPQTPAMDRNRAPSTAFRFEAKRPTFEKPSDRDKSGLRRMPIAVLARTGGPVFHWWFGDVVHDMAGMRSKESIAFDYRHSADHPIGFANSIEATNELWLRGELISRFAEDKAAEIMDLGPEGVPYEASIDFDPYTMVLEYLDEGYQATVNGMTVSGPITIVREWELLRCAICLTGVDGGTRTEFEAGGSESGLFYPLHWKGSKMSKAETAQQTEADPATPPEGAGKQESPGQKSQSTEGGNTGGGKGDARSQFQAELKRYQDAFGSSDGATYFSAGDSFEAAAVKHIETQDKRITELEQELKKAVADAAEAKQKFEALSLGETEFDTGAGKGKATKDGKKTSWESLFKKGKAPDSE